MSSTLKSLFDEFSHKKPEYDTLTLDSCKAILDKKLSTISKFLRENEDKLYVERDYGDIITAITRRVAENEVHNKRGEFRYGFHPSFDSLVNHDFGHFKGIIYFSDKFYDCHSWSHKEWQVDISNDECLKITHDCFEVHGSPLRLKMKDTHLTHSEVNAIRFLCASYRKLNSDGYCTKLNFKKIDIHKSRYDLPHGVKLYLEIDDFGTRIIVEFEKPLLRIFNHFIDGTSHNINNPYELNYFEIKDGEIPSSEFDIYKFTCPDLIHENLRRELELHGIYSHLSDLSSEEARLNSRVQELQSTKSSLLEEIGQLKLKKSNLEQSILERTCELDELDQRRRDITLAASIEVEIQNHSRDLEEIREFNQRACFVEYYNKRFEEVLQYKIAYDHFEEIAIRLDELESKYKSKEDELESKYKSKEDELESKYKSKEDELESKYKSKEDELKIREVKCTEVEQRQEKYRRRISEYPNIQRELEKYKDIVLSKDKELTKLKNALEVMKSMFTSE